MKARSPEAETSVSGERILTVTVYYIADTLALPRREHPIPPDQLALGIRQYQVAADASADEMVDGCAEIIGDLHERLNVGLYIVVFVFIDGLLTYADRLGKLPLRDVVPLP